MVYEPTYNWGDPTSGRKHSHYGYTTTALLSGVGESQFTSKHCRAYFMRSMGVPEKWMVYPSNGILIGKLCLTTNLFDTFVSDKPKWRFAKMGVPPSKSSKLDNFCIKTPIFLGGISHFRKPPNDQVNCPNADGSSIISSWWAPHKSLCLLDYNLI